MTPNRWQNILVFQRKRNASQYQILVEIAEQQPAISQREIAENIGITSQAVSEYVRDLIAEGYIRKLGRGRYEISNEGVDWLISRTEELKDLTKFVTADVIEEVEIEAAIATDSITANERVTLSIQDGILHATPGEDGKATAVALTNTEPGDVVGVTEFEGLLEYERGIVTILTIPTIADATVSETSVIIQQHAQENDVIAVSGTEAIAAVNKAGFEATIRFGTPTAVQEAAVLGLNVLLVAVETTVPSHTDKLRDQTLSYEVVDLTDTQSKQN